MARKIRFPLKMKNGSEVRTLDELKANFDLESVLGYFANGKLHTWLADHYHDEQAEAVSALSPDMPDLNARLCEILGVEYQAENDETDIELIQRRNEKLRILKAETDDRTLIDNVDIVALNQEDIYDILKRSSDTLYLYGERFVIPADNKNVRYVGMNNPLVIFEDGKNIQDYVICNITFDNVRFETYQSKKYNILSKVTTDKQILDNLYAVAITPEELLKILDTRPRTVFLYGDSYSIPFYIRNVSYIGINNPLVMLEKDMSVNWYNNNGISFKNVRYEEGALYPEPIGEFDLRNDSLYSGKPNREGVCIIPYGVKEICDNAFRGCTNLTSLTLPDSLTSIGEYAFYNCNKLKRFNIPNSVTILKRNAFAYCESIESAALPDSITSIDESAFRNCISLKCVIIPNSITRIEGYAFAGCINLNDVVIPDSVIRIGEYAFADCFQLSNITIPKGEMIIDRGAFFETPIRL